ncbi:MAG: hypothetical protein WCL46_10555, partial [Chlorobium sp.]
MEDVTHDGLVRHLGVIGVRIVDGIVLAFAHIRSKGFTVIGKTLWFLRLLCFPFSNKISNPWVRTGRIIWRITQLQDIFIGADWKPFDFAEFRI